MEKSASELGKVLADMYGNAKRGEKVTMIYLFGVKFHVEIQTIGIAEIIEESGIHSTYKTELSKAVKLSKYVIPKLLHKSDKNNYTN